MEKKRKVRNDLLLLGLCLLVSVALVALICIMGAGRKGKTVCVTVDGEEVMTLDLKKDTEQDIVTEKGTNHLVIQGGEVSINRADCENQICVHHISISKRGESIVCLPHGVVVTIE